VGSDYPADLRTRETADMFMALIVKKLLKEGGRAAVVLPDGFLFGDGIKGTLKKLLLRDCKLHTIIRLPKGVFAPYTTIKTNLLFFTKGARWTTAASTSTPTPSGSTNTPTRRATRAIPRPSPSASRNSRRAGLVGQRSQRLRRPGGNRIRLEGRFQNQARTGRSSRKAALATSGRTTYASCYSQTTSPLLGG
jgi:hypothetical protein